MLKRYFFCLSMLSLLLVGCVQKEEITVSKPVEKEKVEETDENKETDTQAREEKLTFKKATQRPVDLSRKDESIASFKPEGFVTENKAKYDLSIKLAEDGKFTASSTIKIDNLSEDTWDDIIFYFIPNSFTEKWKPEHLSNPSTADITHVSIDGEKVEYQLVNDTLQLLVNKPLAPNGKAVVSIDYKFTLPENGFRFSFSENNYYLAQWYPMLATYRSGWDKEPYLPTGESYNTGFSDFTVNYEVPEGFTIISSDEKEAKKQGPKGTLTLKNSKEFFLAITTNMKMQAKKVAGVEVRVFAHSIDEKRIASALDVSVDSLRYFNKYIGKYPYKQLDVIMAEGGMEYPGIVTVTGGEIHEHTIVHEIAHQWFYGLVSNHSYHHTWVDEGLTDFATHLYFMDQKKLSEKEVFEFGKEMIVRDRINNNLKKAHLPLHEYTNGGFSVANYKVPSVELWKLSGDFETARSYLKTYVNFYSYKEVDAHEWFRYTQTFFKIEDPSVLTEWIHVE
ncbi:M1 family metallopeptidase [Bacillus sp. 31A1R]|uniref:M1 family metallopeptidase n=1 Tax=Robertmurraya mangrovi TaxID=3098077 RepID=A0ABU5J375_9BACI|nr:M1 family metallopeptidase [Bacillus sp. 31A1R]MDZ5473797.1 M1 family metallopeptidase [Bacillus sp. 31A1R]